MSSRARMGKEKEEVFTQVVKVIRNLLRVAHETEQQSLEIIPETNIYDGLGIDSVEAMDLIALIQREFGVSLRMDKIAEKETVGEIVDYLCELKNKASRRL